MNTNFDESALLGLFCDKEHFHEQICKPFTSDGYVCATETHRLILIKPELCKGEYAPGKLSVKRVINPDNIDITLTLAKLKKAIKKLSTVKEMEVVSPAVKCKDCDGDGEVEWEYVDTHRYTHLDYHKCPVCNGTGNEREAIMKPTGRMIPHKEAVIGIYEQKINAEHIVALCDAMELLGVDKVRYTASHSMGGNTFILSDGITVIICPNVAYTPGVWVNRKKK